MRLTCCRLYLKRRASADTNAQSANQMDRTRYGATGHRPHCSATRLVERYTTSTTNMTSNVVMSTGKPIYIKLDCLQFWQDCAQI